MSASAVILHDGVRIFTLLEIFEIGCMSVWMIVLSLSQTTVHKEYCTQLSRNIFWPYQRLVVIRKREMRWNHVMHAANIITIHWKTRSNSAPHDIT